MSTLSPAQKQRNRVAVLSRVAPGTPEHTDARRELTAVKLEEHIRRVAAAAPPLTPEQRVRLASLLLGGDAA